MLKIKNALRVGTVSRAKRSHSGQAFAARAWDLMPVQQGESWFQAPHIWWGWNEAAHSNQSHQMPPIRHEVQWEGSLRRNCHPTLYLMWLWGLNTQDLHWYGHEEAQKGLEFEYMSSYIRCLGSALGLPLMVIIK